MNFISILVSFFKKNVAERIQHGEIELNKLIQLAERLKGEIPRKQYEQLQRTIQQRQEFLQNLSKTSQQARGEHEQMVASQTKLIEELNSIHDWFKRLLNDLSQHLDLNFSLNHLHDLQETISVGKSIKIDVVFNRFVLAMGHGDRSTNGTTRSSDADQFD